MTLSVAWIRKAGPHEELVIAADSRLSGGYAWDGCPKILTLPRTDCVLCFAGSTEYAYPMMLQVRNAIEGFRKARSRVMDLSELRGHTMRVVTGLLGELRNPPRGASQSIPDVVFILAGYSWRQKQFRIYLLQWDKKTKAVAYSTASPFAFAGDETAEARRRLFSLLRTRRKVPLRSFSLDFEPFEVLRDMIRDPQFPTIGGPPQLLKIHEHMNYRPYAVFWPDRVSERLTVLGRPLLDYEVTEYLALDPDSLTTLDPTSGQPPRVLGRRSRSPNRQRRAERKN